MKDFLKGMTAVLIAVALLPLAAAFLSQVNQPNELPALSDEVTPPPVYSLIEDVTLFDIVKGTTFTITVEDYLLGSILAHPVEDAEDELIKAQTALFYTYILNRRLSETESPTPALMGADISTDTSRYLPVEITTDADPDEIARIKALVSEALGFYIAYDGVPIQPAFCYSSGGETLSAYVVFGIDYPYLQPVPSSYDSGYTTVSVYSKAEVFARLSVSGKGIELYDDPSLWFSDMTVGSSGYVTEIAFDKGVSMSGRELSHILNLPSARFAVSYNSVTEQFAFTSIGQGDPVGLSLYGANEMARCGSSWKDILKHYYTGVEIVSPL